MSSDVIDYNWGGINQARKMTDEELVARFEKDVRKYHLDEDSDMNDAMGRYCDASRGELLRRLTAAASGPVEQRVMDAIERELGDASRYALQDHRTPNGAWDNEGWCEDLLNGMRQAVRAALTPASEEGA